MKKLLMSSLALAAVLPLAAQASCESVKADIAQKIVANGVPQSAFRLDIVPADRADAHGVQVVGHCESDTQKIIYIRTGDDAASTDDAPSP